VDWLSHLITATDCVLRSFKAGDEIIAMDDLYGGTYRMFTRIYKDSGIKFHFVDMNDIEIQVINQREYKTGLGGTYESFDEIGRYSRNRCQSKKEKNSFC
jgi:hypothetical protein